MVMPSWPFFSVRSGSKFGDARSFETRLTAGRGPVSPPAALAWVVDAYEYRYFKVLNLVLNLVSAHAGCDSVLNLVGRTGNRA